MRNEIAKQRGGTLLGVVIGLVVGLAIALVVALMITKSPVPFNKQSKSDKAATNVSTSADPNQPMYRNKEIPKDLVKEADPVKPAESAKQEPAAAEKNAKSENGEPAAKVDDKWIYYLQVGAFKNSVDAESMRARLALLGLEANISEIISQSGTMYRVRVGPFNNLEKMVNSRAKLAENGVESSVTRFPK